MSDLGKFSYYLGIEVTQHERGITLNQNRYELKFLEDTWMRVCNSVQIPMESGLKLEKSNGEREIDATSYRKTIGCFRYLFNTQPELSYCVGVLNRCMKSPKESHGVAWKQCLRYLRGSATFGLTFERSTPEKMKLIGHSDSSQNVDPDD